MVCGDVKILLSRYQDNELGQPLRESIALHIQGCDSCAAEYRELADVTARVKQLREVDTGPYFTAQLMGKILTTEEQRQAARWWARLPLPLSPLPVRLVYSFVFIIFLVLGILVSNGTLIDLNPGAGNNQQQETAMVKLLVESQDLGLINVQDQSLALLVSGNNGNNGNNGNGEHDEE